MSLCIQHGGLRGGCIAQSKNIVISRYVMWVCVDGQPPTIDEIRDSSVTLRMLATSLVLGDIGENQQGGNARLKHVWLGAASETRKLPCSGCWLGYLINAKMI